MSTAGSSKRKRNPSSLPPGLEIRRTITPDDTNAELWRRGYLGHILRRHRQTDLYNRLHEHTESFPDSIGPIVANIHRRCGKSFALRAYCWERSLEKPGTVCKFVAPELVQGRDYVKDIDSKLFALCPHDLTPEGRGDDLIFRNPYWGDPDGFSVIQLKGVKASGGESIRGGRANVIVLDEVREMSRVRYMIDNIFSFMFQDQDQPILILSTSTPKSMGHDFVDYYIPKAIREKRYIIFPGDKVGKIEGNRDVTERDRQIILGQCGTKESVAYRREWLCELVSDPTALVCPEFAPMKREIVGKHRQPEWFDAYVGVDWGWQDHNGIVFGYLDFLAQTLRIVGEVFMHNVSTGELIGSARAKEAELWQPREIAPARYVDHLGGRWRYRSVRRVGDHSKQQLADAWRDHGYVIAAAKKWDRDAALAQFRHGMSTGKITIDPECENLIHQLEHGIWRESADGARREFARNQVDGHLDLVAALVYLYRHVTWHENPYPDRGHDPVHEFDLAGTSPSRRIHFERLDTKFRPLN